MWVLLAAVPALGAVLDVCWAKACIDDLCVLNPYLSAPPAADLYDVCAHTHTYTHTHTLKHTHMRTHVSQLPYLQIQSAHK